MEMIQDRAVVDLAPIILLEEVREGRVDSSLQPTNAGGTLHGIEALVVLSHIHDVMTAVAVLCLADCVRKPVAGLCLGWNQIADAVRVEESLITAVLETMSENSKEALSSRDIRAASNDRVRRTPFLLIRRSELSS